MLGNDNAGPKSTLAHDRSNDNVACPLAWQERLDKHLGQNVAAAIHGCTMAWLGILASIGMAVGPPLVYADQAYSIVKKRDSSGFSHDVCGVIIIANIIRIFFWLGNRFETPLLFQSILLIISQLFLLSLCLHYAPLDSSYTVSTPLPTLSPLPDAEDEPGHREDYLDRPMGPSKKLGQGVRRPFEFWQWEGYGSYLEFLAGMIIVLGMLQLVFGRWMWYIDTLGFIALTIESTLPIPQFLSNWRRKSTSGLRVSTLCGWAFGDSFKTGYFFLRHSPIQFKLTAIMTLCWDAAVFGQRLYYGSDPPPEEPQQYAVEEETRPSSRP